MKCRKCGAEKPLREFPRTEHSGDCQHPQSCCLRCTVNLLEAGNVLCPHPGCTQVVSEGFHQQCEEELEYLFPSPLTPNVAPPVAAQSLTSTNTYDFVRATFLSGEICRVSYYQQKTIMQLKLDIQKKVGVAAMKQKLFLGENELKSETSRHTLAYYGIKPGCSIQVHVQLLEIPVGLKAVVFDLSWGYPYNSWRRDYLDATAFCYNGCKELAYTDFRYNHNTLVCLDGVIHHSGHSGGLHTAQIGRHRITVNFDSMPQEVDTIFFTLSSWRAPYMDVFRNPTLDFHDPSNPEVQLCENYVEQAPHSQAIVMCALRRQHQVWVAEAVGKPTRGNVNHYWPIRETLRELAKNFI